MSSWVSTHVRMQIYSVICDAAFFLFEYKSIGLIETHVLSLLA